MNWNSLKMLLIDKSRFALNRLVEILLESDTPDDKAAHTDMSLRATIEWISAHIDLYRLDQYTV